MTAGSVTVVLPTYNERATVCDVVRDAVAVDCVDGVVVVDDDSPDETWRIVRETFVDESVRATRRTEESGLSSAVLRGIEAAETEHVVVMDADGQHPTEVIPQIVRRLDAGVDLVASSRHEADGKIVTDWGADRTVLSAGASLLAWVAIPAARRLQDPMSGMFGVRRNLVTPVAHRFEPRGYKILLEILAMAPVDTVAEVPIDFGARQGGESKTDLGAIVDYAAHCASLGVRSRRPRHTRRVPAQEVEQ